MKDKLFSNHNHELIPRIAQARRGNANLSVSNDELKLPLKINYSVVLFLIFAFSNLNQQEFCIKKYINLMNK